MADHLGQLPEAPRWRGINHLALVTPDMDATVRFYAGVLGMRVVATTMAGPMRHYFFEMSPQNTVAFFEIRGAETFEKGAGSPTDRAIQMDHISFNVPDEAALEQLRKRLLAAGSEVTEVVDHELHPVGVLHRPQRHRARGVVLGHRRHRPRGRSHRPRALRRPRPGARPRRAARRPPHASVPTHPARLTSRAAPRDSAG